MGKINRRRYRFPVFSRLTWAWLGSFTALAMVASVTFVISDYGKPQRVALPIQKLERIAPPTDTALEETQIDNATGVTLAAAPILRDGSGGGAMTIDPSAEGLPGSDGLTFTENGELLAQQYSDDGLNYSVDDVVITIDGKQQGATPIANAASVRPVAPTAIREPDGALLRSTPLGKVPRIAADGRKAVDYYTRPFSAKRGQPKVSIIVGGLGLNRTLTERAIDELPPEVSLSFAPYAKDLDFWTAKARKAGHEVLIELPMEGHGPNQEALGAAALLSTRTAEENLQRLDWLMSRFGGYFAATNYLGSKFSADEAAMAPVLARLRESGVGYIDDTGTALRTGERTGVTITSVSRIIPPAPSPTDRSAVRNELLTLEALAERDGAAIGKTYAYAATINEIAEWAQGLKAKDIAVAPTSAILHAHNATR